MTKLLIVYHAGLAEDAKAIFQEYAKQGIDLTVIVPSKFCSSTGSCFAYSEEDDEKTYRFIPIEFKAGFNFLRLFGAIKRIKPDVIHVLSEYSSIYLAQTILCRNILYGKKVPVLAYAFQNIPFSPPPFIFEFSIRFFRRVIYKTFYPLIFWYHKKNVNGITGSNSQALLNIKNLNPNVPVRLIFWGVDLKKFFSKSRDACKEKLGIARDIKLFGYFGRIIEEKGLDKLALAASKINDCCLMFVGDGDYKNKLVKIFDFLDIKNRVFLYKSANHSDLAVFYNSLDVFVLPSETISQWKEQYGRVLVEAMACGLPVVGSSSGAIPEVLKGYPKGLIFREGDVDDLVKKIKGAENLRFPADFNLDGFLYKFSAENFVREHIKFYEELLIQLKHENIF